MSKILLTVFMLLSLCMNDLIAQPLGRRANVNTLTTAQRTTLATAMYTYIDAAIISEHDCNTEYFNINGRSWSIHGPEMFLNWHREYIAEMEAAIQPTLSSLGLSYLPRWNPADGIGIISAFVNTDADCTNTNCDGSPNPFSPCANPSGFPNGWNTAYPAALSPTLNCASWTDYEAFTEFVRNGYHVMGHVASGGVMGNFKSPAAPMFWLWHAMIDDVYWDYQKDCQPNAEIFMQDNTSDNSAEPSSGTLYLSQDIWVRLYQDTKTGPAASNPGLLQHPYGSQNFANEGIHENPYHSPTNPNYVYVKIRNNGTEEFSGGRLHVYWSKASTGLNWPTTWDNYYPGGSPILHGDEILPSIAGQVPPESNFIIPPINAGGQFIMEVPWYTVPKPDDFTNDIHHFCLLARIVSSHDPMTVTEGPALWSNVKENNNIVWKNVSIYYDPGIFSIVGGGGGDPVEINEQTHFTGVYVTNMTKYPELTTLTFPHEAVQGQNDFFEAAGAVFVRMDDELYSAWKDGGQKGEEIKYLGETNKRHYVRLLSPKASLKNINLEAGANHALEMGFALEKQIEPQAFNFDVQQYNEKGIVGGERYQVIVSGRKDLKFSDSKTETRSKFAILVSPNPTHSLFEVSYNLDAVCDVSFSLSDLKGSILLTKELQQQSQGAYTESFDVNALQAGIYILRIDLGSDVIIKKIIID